MLSQKDIEDVIKDFWWGRYYPSYRRMNERTRSEIEELAKRLHKLMEEKFPYESD